MDTQTLPLVTIIGEAVLRERLIDEVRRAGATGFTISEAEGDGSRHLRSGDRPGENIRLETITSREVADRLLTRLAADYFPHFAVIVFVSEVQVIRGAKYV